jgi:poly-beta-1,6-N-acetyl-D-glucosamine synthase
MNDLFLFFRNLIYLFVGLMWVKYYLFLLVSPFYPIRELRRKIKHKKNLEKKGLLQQYNPKVSVVIPAWNEEVGIIKTIKSVLSNDYENIEIVVVNDGSTDKSDEIMKSFIKYLSTNKIPGYDKITYVYRENGGKGRALNTGIEHTTGEIILTMDADSAIEANGIRNLVNYYLDPEIMAVVGNVKVANNNTIVGLLQQLEYYFGFYFKRAYAMLGAEYIFGGACASFRRSVFEELGLFDVTNKTEDIEMSMRTRFAGMKCTYAEDVIAYTEGASNIPGLVNQRVRWKKGRFDTFWKYRSMFFSTSDNHNTALSFFILPLAMISEIQLLIEPLAISMLITYSIISSDFLSLALGIVFIFQTYLVACVFNNEKIRLGRLLSFIYTWPLFYILVWIEFLALCKSIIMSIRGEEIEWQKWNRTGIGSEINL